MQAVPLTGRAAVVATLRAKLSIAEKRALYGATMRQRENESAAAKLYRARLVEMGEIPTTQDEEV